ncbi:MAG: hypothetical protein WAU25_10660 [Nitrososphaeraceae archaeon]
MKGWKNKSIDNLSDRLDRLEVEREVESGSNDGVAYATAQELELMTPHENYGLTGTCAKLCHITNLRLCDFIT